MMAFVPSQPQCQTSPVDLDIVATAAIGTSKLIPQRTHLMELRENPTKKLPFEANIVQQRAIGYF